MRVLLAPWEHLTERLLTILDEPTPRNGWTEQRRFIQLLELEDDAYEAEGGDALIRDIVAARDAIGLTILKMWRPSRMHG